MVIICHPITLLANQVSRSVLSECPVISVIFSGANVLEGVIAC